MTALNQAEAATALSPPPDVDKTAQQIFDECVEHLARQGRPAVDSAGQCRYRTANGDMCAVGIFIPDSEYRPDLEGNKASQVIDRARLPRYMADNRTLFTALQWAHDTDSSRGIGVWLVNLPTRLRGVARQFDLDASAVFKHFPVPA